MLGIYNNMDIQVLYVPKLHQKLYEDQMLVLYSKISKLQVGSRHQDFMRKKHEHQVQWQQGSPQQVAVDRSDRLSCLEQK